MEKQHEFKKIKEQAEALAEKVNYNVAWANRVLSMKNVSVIQYKAACLIINSA